jgi:hypothetical protein
MKLVFYLGLFLATTLLSYGQTAEKKAPAPKEQKKEQHVKVMVSQNGKVVEIDTTFNFADEKVVKFKVDSILTTLNVTGPGSSDNKVIMIRKGKDMYMSHPGGNGPGEEQISVFYDGKVPPPPPPPMPGMHIRSFQMHGGDPFAMDSNDQDIVTYEKKDIGKGLEKITIVRKKRPENQQSKEVEVKVEVDEETKK